jgi:hypothetical protein
MRASEPALTEPMQLEWVNAWVDMDESGYRDLIAAVAEWA